VAWFSVWVREAVGSIPAWAHLKIFFFFFNVYFLNKNLNWTIWKKKEKKKSKLGGVAQLEERALCKREAPGSKPGISTKQK
jgi:hypothetical protein